MALDLTQVNQEVSNFNAKYKVNFNLDGYIRVSQSASVFGKFGWDLMYRKMFEDLGKEMLKQKIQGNVEKNLTLVDMYKDFETKIMRGYRHACKKDGFTGYPSPNTGFDKESLRHYLNGIVGAIPKSIKEDAVQKYKNGEIRIRDMVALAKSLKTLEGDAKKQAIIKVMACAEALREVNASRTSGWRFWHRWRNAAEIREMDNLMRLVDEVEPYASTNKDKLDRVRRTYKVIQQEMDRLKPEEPNANLEEEYELVIEENKPENSNNNESIIDNQEKKIQIDINIEKDNNNVKLSQPIDIETTKQINAPTNEIK